MIWDEECPFVAQDEDEFSDLLAEIENYKTLPILLKNNDNFEILSHELNQSENEFKKTKMRQSEMKFRFENVSQLLETKLKENDEQARSIEELRSFIKEMKKVNYDLTIENEKKLLNAYKRFLKLKWLHSTKDNELEALIFNEKNAYLHHCIFSKTDPCVTDKLWTEISRACDNRMKKLF